MPIDRQALVQRHHPRVRAPDPFHALSLGNGRFAVTADVTGLQTFADAYEPRFPLCILSDWGWHERPLPAGMRVEDFRWTEHRVGDRLVPYPQGEPGQEALCAWMNENPHRLNLGRIGLSLTDSRGRRATLEDIHAIDQQLDLWQGHLDSRFMVFGTPVHVRTCVHPHVDALAVQITSPLVAAGQLALELSFPWRDRPRAWEAARPTVEHSQPVVDTLVCRRSASGCLQLQRQCDAMRWMVELRSDGLRDVIADEPLRVRIPLAPPVAADGPVSCLLRFTPIEAPMMGVATGTAFPVAVDEATTLASPGAPTVGLGSAAGAAAQPMSISSPRTSQDSAADAAAAAPERDVAQAVRTAFTACRAHWNRFWHSGGAIELQGSRDPRAPELERRIVLSQYLTAIQSCGMLPPQETGLTCNSWSGKFHLEMHWWHSVHFASWGRFEHLESTLPLYHRLLPVAEATARRQGYPGARWMKMIGPEGRESPNTCGPFLIWQQPHPLYYAALVYRHRPTTDSLRQWWPVVQATAAFMAAFAQWDPLRRRYCLPPPLVPVSENLPLEQGLNPTFELAYWRFGLRIAIQWSRHLGIEPDPVWQRVVDGLADLPEAEGVYLTQEGLTSTYTAYAFDHPALLGCCGFLPGEDVDPATMRRTLARVQASWKWDGTWGWDFPLAAFTAARCGEPALAVDLLLMDRPTNVYLPNGHNFYSRDLPLYLPGNGGLLTAVAMMAAGWDGDDGSPAPGFPQDGSWSVRHEGLVPMLGASLAPSAHATS